jgi:hypothetical protein
MEVELQSRARIRDIERETAHIRLLAAAERANSRRRRPSPEPNRRTALSTPLRLVRRAVRQAGALRPAA